MLACSRYVGLNPVRAGMVASPGDYEWSSYRARAGGGWPSWLDQDDCYRSLGHSGSERSQAYRDFMEREVDTGERALIHAALQRNQLTGDARFVDEVERRIGRRVELRGRGRPRKPKK